MSWMELRVDAAPEAVDWVCTRLAATSYSHGIHIIPYSAADGDEQWVTQSCSWASTIYLHLPCDGHEHAHLSVIEAALAGLHQAGLTSDLRHRLTSARPVVPKLISRRIGRRFVVTTAELEDYVDDPAALVLSLKPSVAFGSGFHPATELVLQLLEQHVVSGMNALDLGSGSGILSVAMAKLGAQVVAIDNDRAAVQATYDAVQRNSVNDNVSVLAGSLGRGNQLGHWMGGAADPTMQPLDLPTPFDLIVANIQAQFHIALAPDFRAALQPVTVQGGLLITSGYTTDYAPGVEAALKTVGFEAIAEARAHDWAALVHRLGG